MGLSPSTMSGTVSGILNSCDPSMSTLSAMWRNLAIGRIWHPDDSMPTGGYYKKMDSADMLTQMRHMQSQTQTLQSLHIGPPIPPSFAMQSSPTVTIVTTTDSTRIVEPSVGSYITGTTDDAFPQ